MPFDPWSLAQGKFPIALDVAGPPCSACRHWKPVALTDKNGNYDGVRLCHADEQFHDFSCFKERLSG